MKKYCLLFISILIALSLCSCTKKNTATAPVQEASNTVSDASDKVPDPNAPELTIVSVFYPNSDKTKIEKSMTDLESLDANGLIEKLKEYEVISENINLESFDLSDDKTAVLNLSTGDGSSLDLSNNYTLYSIVDTFIENYELDKLSIVINNNQDNNLMNLQYKRQF